MAYTNPEETTEALLMRIRQAQETSIKSKNIALMVEPFAALLVHLSNDAERVAQKNIRIQKWMVGIAVTLLILCIVQLVKMFAH